MLLLALLGCAAEPDEDTDPAASTAHHLAPSTTVAGPVTAFAASSSGVLIAHDRTITRLTEPPTQVSTEGLPPGRLVFVGELGGNELVFVHGKGLHRRTAAGWGLADAGLDNPLLGLAGNDARPTPMAVAEGPDGVGWLATVGGLFRSDDGGGGWGLVDMSSSGSLALLFTDVAVLDDRIVATAQVPTGIMPADFDGLLAGAVFSSEDGGTSWTDITGDLGSDHATAAAFGEDGRVYVATLDQGVFALGDDGWSPLGGPSDAVDVAVGNGGLNVASASRGLWRLDADRWTAAGSGPAAGIGPTTGVTWGGEVVVSTPGDGDSAPNSAGGTVHIAISHHINYYHSYRGDTPDDDGFGQDIDVMRRTLTWLEAHPEVRADWDSDNAWTTDLWMPQHAPDVLAHLQERVGDGRDQVRLMSWNNGAMAASTAEEFTEAVLRGRASTQAAIGPMQAGVQPQECMFSPDHLSGYPALGIDWVTLFYAANGFTALRQDVDLAGHEAFNPVTLHDPLEGGEMTAVPVWHHADVLDHGGLAGWAQQLHDSHAGDTLLVVHFDADSETWENFDREIAAARALPFVEWSTIGDYLADHPPVARHVLPGDVADGTGDGFQSWAEKDANHRLFAVVQQARAADASAALLAPDDPEVSSLRRAAFDARLLALATTNYGLAAPLLHPDRAESGSAQARTARVLAAEALTVAASSVGDPGDVLVINPRESGGITLLRDHRLAAEWVAPGRLLSLVDADGATIPAAIDLSEDDGELYATVTAVVEVSPGGVESWVRAEDGGPALGELTDADAPTVPNLLPPFIDCADGGRVAVLEGRTAEVSPLRYRASTMESWSIDICGLGSGTITRRLSRWQGLPGVVVEVDAQLGETGPEPSLRSVVLTPLDCHGGIDTLTWRTPGGTIRTRDARRDVESWNGLAADGYAIADCADGTTIAVAHDTRVRSSIAFMPVRNEGGEGLLAPLGTMWADGPFHEARRTGGLGTGDRVVPIVGSQFRPAAPDWAGTQVLYRLLVHDQADHALLDLFAHGPVVALVE
ncbi:MAG: hypothetical protein ACI8PZ_001603 [Myxococcota bacterium]|jgi:hypothetical protein